MTFLLRYAARDAATIRDIIRDRLRRRLSAPKRIGCPYHVAAFSAAPSLASSARLPGEAIARLFEAVPLRKDRVFACPSFAITTGRH